MTMDRNEALKQANAILGGLPEEECQAAIHECDVTDECLYFDDYIAVFKKRGFEFTDEEQAILRDGFFEEDGRNSWKAEFQMTAEELDDVAGGMYDADGYLIVTSCNSCRGYIPEDGDNTRKPRCGSCLHSYRDAGIMYCKVRYKDDDPFA